MEQEPQQSQINEDHDNTNNVGQVMCDRFHNEEDGTYFCKEHDCYLCEHCVSEHMDKTGEFSCMGCDSVINILTQQFNKWRLQIDKMEEIKQKFIKNLQSQDKMIKLLKKENFNQPVLEARDLVFAYKKIRDFLDGKLSSVVLFCKKRMVRDVVMFEIDLAKVEMRLKELEKAVSLVNLVGQYLPPLPKISINGVTSSVFVQSNNPSGKQQEADKDQAGALKTDDKELKNLSPNDFQDELEKMSSSDIVEKALFWSEKADSEDMDRVMSLFRDSPQDRLILMKIRFEQRIIQVKHIIHEQSKKIDKLKRETEFLRIGKTREQEAFQQAYQQIQMAKLQGQQKLSDDHDKISLSPISMTKMSSFNFKSIEKKQIKKIKIVKDLSQVAVKNASQDQNQHNWQVEKGPSTDIKPNESHQLLDHQLIPRAHMPGHKKTSMLVNSIDKWESNGNSGLGTFRNHNNQGFTNASGVHGKGYGMALHGYGTGASFYQSQSQFSEFDDQMSSVVINYENLAGFIENNQNNQHGSTELRRNTTAHNFGGMNFNSNLSYQPTGNIRGFAQNLGNNRNSHMNMSSTLYDFIRDNNGEDDHEVEHAAGQRRFVPTGANPNTSQSNMVIGNQLDQTGLEVDTEIDFLDTQQLDNI